jgi:hypothetical protein
MIPYLDPEVKEELDAKMDELREAEIEKIMEARGENAGEPPEKETVFVKIP